LAEVIFINSKEASRQLLLQLH